MILSARLCGTRRKRTTKTRMKRADRKLRQVPANTRDTLDICPQLLSLLSSDPLRSPGARAALLAGGHMSAPVSRALCHCPEPAWRLIANGRLVTWAVFF